MCIFYSSVFHLIIFCLRSSHVFNMSHTCFHVLNLLHIILPDKRTQNFKLYFILKSVEVQILNTGPKSLELTKGKCTFPKDKLQTICKFTCPASESAELHPARSSRSLSISLFSSAFPWFSAKIFLYSPTRIKCKIKHTEGKNTFQQNL